jgi:hypothetical protein
MVDRTDQRGAPNAGDLTSNAFRTDLIGDSWIEPVTA